ncbi:LacI family transcriptional regulator [Heyndrickxia shackletonii]|uniref:LacI family transcriptional regulator n=1 Tax=Heyndrickxia shackletonii TaxID=157838 RepID=A0A0Q3WRP3_9BACI|nr:LacI family DNA-binding transcriptional regulator [Heyndrickxia shackletonii]KQL50743.1 LacI family transcriptional regulator [Heyndrickxia shackletonii]NEY99697.1 LacI family transcriptional regulator [Heyndrickxia shackletonii]
MTVTIKDVAKLAGVAPSTVSRVIANNPRISDSTKKKVRDAMDYLGYHPNINARSLAARSTQALGLVMPSSADKAFQNPFFPEVIRGISTKAHEKGFALYISTGMNEAEIFDGVVEMVQGRRVDGIILLSTSMDDKIVEYLYSSHFPFTVVGKPYKYENKISHVDNDNYRAAGELTKHLIDLGHERIAFIGGSLNLVMTTDRLLGYERALRNANIPFREDYIVHEEFLKEGGSGAVEALMALAEPPTAFVVMDDLMALGVLGMLSEKGISVPDDVSVVSFNNVMLAELSNPPLTSVDINIFQLGYRAADCLLDTLENEDKKPERIIIPHKIIDRMSSAPYR